MSDKLQMWRDALLGTEELTLPSGLVATVRKSVNLGNLVAEGQLPQTLLNAVQDLIKKGEGKHSTDDLPKVMPGINAVVIAVVVDPPISQNGDDNSIPVREIPLGDRMELFEYANRAAVALRPFREGEGQPGEGVGDGEIVPDAAEPDSRDSG